MIIIPGLDFYKKYGMLLRIKSAVFFLDHLVPPMRYRLKFNALFLLIRSTRNSKTTEGNLNLDAGIKCKNKWAKHYFNEYLIMGCSLSFSVL